MEHALFALTALLVTACAECLRMVTLDIPSSAVAGEAVELSCVFDLETDRLYSVKWYRDEVEFYRFVPNDWPKKQYLPLPGLRVDMVRSGSRSLWLQAVEVATEGRFRCEASAEGPSFQTVEAEGTLNVTVLPSEGPRIWGGRSGGYEAGDPVALNCTSAKSRPAARLQWYLNDVPVGVASESEHSLTLHEDGLESSSLSLRLVVRQHHLAAGDGGMRLRCTASIDASRYHMSDEETLLSRHTASPLHTREADGSETSLNSGSKNKKGPKQMSVHSGSGTLLLPLQLLLITPLLLHMRWRMTS